MMEGGMQRGEEEREGRAQARKNAREGGRKQRIYLSSSYLGRGLFINYTRSNETIPCLIPSFDRLLQPQDSSYTIYLNSRAANALEP